jgi:hypothetical protein
MSYSQTISNAVDKIVLSYIDKVVSTYPAVISKEQLLGVWTNNMLGGLEGDAKVVTAAASGELTKMSKNELVELCKAKGLKVSGSKPELIQRLVSFESQPKIVDALAPPAQQQPPPPQPKLVHKEKPPIALYRNKFGNFEHTDTHFVFNEKTEKVNGKQNADGTISDLTLDDIETCNKWKFTYDIPLNLQDGKNMTTDKALLELEEEEEEELEVDVEEEEEEEEEEELEVEIEIDEDE